MPYVVRPKLRIVLAGAALLVSFVLPAAADAACPTTPTSKPFAPFGDDADYSLLANGHFESGTAGWSLSNASVVSENESYQVRSASDEKSLRIESNGGMAVSPAFCVGAEHPTFRFFARRTNGAWGALFTKLRWTGADGRARELLVGAPSADSYTSWLPSSPMVLGPALPLDELGGTASVRLVFAPLSGGGDWLVDDIYIDPYRR